MVKDAYGSYKGTCTFLVCGESILHGGPDDRPLPVVVYLDNIAMCGDTQKQVLEDTLKAVKRLAAAGFMLNLHKSQLVQAAAQVLGHLWTSGGFWAVRFY